MLKTLHEDLGRLELLESEECAAPLPSLKGHDLKRLWAAIESRLLKVFPTEPETGWISRAIDQLHQIDPGAEDFRYPTKIKSGSTTLQSLPRIVSLRNLDRDMRSLLNTLDGAAIEIRSRLEYIAEALALERQQWRCEE
ncbi:hypothetical protein HJC22_32030 [Corallococcus exiguus]|uniref:hypothetical protein n=1 Tax=Corallococcus exiguus TaxID=83462 RepID=UPI001470AB0E|nr:hypothetical protein [Corallococcus exiguus]NNC20360.1 hypothetical protein [Corallococcus exiguus]